MKIGDNVRVIAVPAVLPQDDMETRALFNLCIGKIFPILGHQGELIELEVGEVLGKPACTNSIWIEPGFVEMITDFDTELDILYQNSLGSARFRQSRVIL